MNAQRKQNQQIQKQIQNQNQQYKAVTFSAQLTNLPSPNILKSPSAQLFNVYSSAEFEFNKEPQLLNKVNQKKVFAYETYNNQEGRLSQKVQPITSVYSSTTDLQPQFSLHSPFRGQDSQKDLQTIGGKGPVAKSNPGNIDSAVRGRKLAGQDVDVICTLSQSDSYRLRQMTQGKKVSNEEVNYYAQSNDKTQQIVNINTASASMNYPSGFYNTQQPQQLLQSIQQLQQQQQKPHQQTSQKRNQSSEQRKQRLMPVSQSTTNLQRRKGSTDSLRSSANRQTSNGRNNERKSGKSSSNSQSANRSKNQQQQQFQQQQQQDSKIMTRLQSQQNSQAKGMRRPNSAAILTQDPSQTNFKTMVTSPTLTQLTREPSQQFLPPKPKISQRNQTFSKLQNPLYSSIGTFPISTGQISAQSASHSNAQSQQKRVTSASSERPRDFNKQIRQEQENIKFESEQDGNMGQIALSPLRKRQIDNYMTNPSSTQKLGNSQNRGKSKQRQQNSSQKRKRNNNNKNNKIIESVQTLSPNIERVRINKVIQEENKEEDDTLRESFKEEIQGGIIVPLKLDESEIKKNKIQIEKDNENNEGGGLGTNDSQNTSISFQIQAKQLLKTKTFKDTLEKDILKDFKQQLQTINLKEDEEKIKKRIIDKNLKISKENELSRKAKMELFKLQMNKKLEGVSKGQNLMGTGKMKRTLTVQQLEQKESNEILKKKLEKKEQYLKEKEERMEFIEIIKDTMKSQANLAATQSQSNSQGRRREHSKSQTRPFSAKMPQSEAIQSMFQQQQQQETNQQQLLIRVPGLKVENPKNVYDVIATSQKYEPLSEQIIDPIYYQMNNKNQNDENLVINDFIKKQKKERSKKRKNVENNEVFKEFKKQKALKQLNEDYKQKYEQFKMKQIQQIKGKIKRKPKTKQIQLVQEEQSQTNSQVVVAIKKGRSKSKRRVDEEKENRRGSVSPLRGARSGTRSNSDKKRNKSKNKIIQKTQLLSAQPSEAKINKLTMNVYELLQQQKDNASNKSTKINVLFSQQNPHQLKQGQNNQQIARELIKTQKLNLKVKQNQHSQSSYKDENTQNYELSFNQQNQIFQDNQQQMQQFKSHDIYQLNNNNQQQQDNNNIDQQIFKNEQLQQQLTPVIQQKAINRLSSNSNSQVIIQGRPSEIVKSFELKSSQAVSPKQKKQIIQDWFKQTSNKLEQFQKQQDCGIIAVNKSPKNEEVRKSLKIQEGAIKQLEDINMYNQLSPIRSPNHNKQILSNEKNNNLNKSGKSKKNNSSQKKNKSKQQQYKRNELKSTQPQLGGGTNELIQQFQSTQQIMGEKKQIPKQIINLEGYRPKSANIQQLKKSDLVQVQKKKQDDKLKSAVFVQKCLRGYLGRKAYKQKKEQFEYERNFQMIQQRYYNQENQQQQVETVQDDSSIEKFNVQQEDSKQDSTFNRKTSSNNVSQLSKSQLSLKNLLAQEQENLKKKRPNSSDVINKSNQQQKKDNTSQKSEKDFIQNIQKKVSDIIDYQTILNSKIGEQNKIIKGKFNLDSMSSLQASNRVPTEESKSSNNEIEVLKKIKYNQNKNTTKLNNQRLQQQNIKVKSQEIDSLSSVNKGGASQETEKAIQIDEQKDSFIREHQHEESKKDSLQEVLHNINEEQKKISLKQGLQNQQKQFLDNMNNVISKQRIEERWNSGKKESESKNQNNFFQKLNNANNHYNQAHSQLVQVPQFHINSQNSEDRDQSWQFDRKSFQEFFDQNSNVLQNTDQKQSKESAIQGSGSKQKASLSRKLLQYEEMLEVMSKNHEKEKQELKKLQQRSYLSPRSLKKKLSLERWVTKQEEQLNQQRKLYQQNVGDMITKIEKDLQQTKKRIGTKKKGSHLFNNSVEWSHDMSIGHLSNSIHSTPRIVKPNSSILALNQIPQTERSNKRIPFEYKGSSKNEPMNIFELGFQQTNNSAKSSDPVNADERTEKFEEQKQIQGQQQQQIKKQDDELENMLVISNNNKEKNLIDINANIFNKNLANYNNNNNNQEYLEHQEDSEAIVVEENISQLKDDEIEEESKLYQLQEQSLSKLDPPQFQSPTMSAISPNQQLKDFSNEDFKMQNAPFLDNYDPTSENKEFHISTLSPESQQPQSIFNNEINQYVGVKMVQEELEPSRPQSFNEGQNDNSQLADAFLALKEPEQPISFKVAQQMREGIESKDSQADQLTDYILQLLMEQLQGNMFPKRPIVSSNNNSIKSPQKQKQDSQAKMDFFELDDLPSKAKLSSRSPSKTKTEDDIKVHEITNLQGEKSSLKEKILGYREEKKKIKKLRGIKTSMKVVDSYVLEIFKKVKDSEDEFVENLSTPLNKDPLEILLHLQNVCLDQEYENVVAFQQSVLPVDLYLDIERNKQKVQANDQPAMEGTEYEEPENKSMLAEWENIHNKVIFDAINEALDNFRPYGLRGPPMPWSQQTRTLTYKNGQQVDTVLKSVKQKVLEWARTFSGALPCSELLQEYGIRGPLDEDKLNLLREERLALVLASEIEENEVLWTDYEYEETQSKLDIADMILEVLAEEAVKEVTKIKESRLLLQDSTASTPTVQHQEE